MAPGTYQITVSLGGMSLHTGLYTIDAGETKQISVKLEPRSPLTTSPTLPSTLSQDTRETTVHGGSNLGTSSWYRGDSGTTHRTRSCRFGSSRGNF